MMDELGHILREARENKGLTLTKVQSEIRINTKFLSALEEGNYHLLPTPVHVRGFLRNYARFLGLDPDPLLARYEARQKEKPVAAPLPTLRQEEDPNLSPLPIQQGPTFFDPVNFEVNAGYQNSGSSAVRLIIIAALLIAVGLVFNRFLPLITSGQDGSEALTESIAAFLQGQPESDLAPGEIDPDAPILVPEMATGGIPITSTNRNPGMAPSSLDPADALPPSPTRPALPATMDTIELRLEITERGWMEVTIDGDVVFTGIVRDTDPTYEFTAQEEAIVNTGNAIGVFVYINDIAWGRMGERGESREEIWRTTQ